MKADLHEFAHQVAQEQIAYWKGLRWSVPDAAAALGMSWATYHWKDIEQRLAARWIACDAILMASAKRMAA